MAATNSRSSLATQVVTPWQVHGGASGIEYNKLCQDFGASLIMPDLIKRIELLTKVKAHKFLRRGIFFAHRDLSAMLDHVDEGRPFYLYTGRNTLITVKMHDAPGSTCLAVPDHSFRDDFDQGPSSEALHLGHLVPFHFTAWLQKTFRMPLVIQLTDDEKFLWRNLDQQESERLAFENAKDIIACGFDRDLTFIFSDYAYMGGDFYRNITRIQRLVTFNSVRSIFGLAGEDSIGKIAFPAIQAAPSFPSSFPHIFGLPSKDVKCLIPCAIDQDPYFRMKRDVAPRLGENKPCLIESSFFPALQGDSGKMNASNQNSAIFVADTPQQIKDKIHKFAYSGGRDTLQQQLAEGADLSVDVPFKWLSFFLEDDAELADIGQRYANGDKGMLTGHVKQRLVEVLTGVVEKHQQARAAVSEDDVRHFMAVRRMTCPGAHADITSDRAGVVMRPGLICCDLEGSTWQYSVAGAD